MYTWHWAVLLHLLRIPSLLPGAASKVVGWLPLLSTPEGKDNPGSSLARPTPPFLHTRDFVGCRVLLRHAEYEATEICRVRRLYMVGYITQLSTINHHLQLYNIIPILFHLPVLHYILGWSWLLLSLSPTPRSESLAVYPPTPIIIIVITPSTTMSDREYRSEARKNNDPPISQVGSVGSNASAPSGASPPPGSTSPGLHVWFHVLELIPLASI